MSKNISDNLNVASQKNETYERTLLTLFLDDGEINIVCNDNQSLVFNNKTYFACDCDIGTIETKLDGDKEQISISIKTKWQEISAYVANNLKGISGKQCKIETVFLDYLDEGSIWEFEGVIDDIQITASEVKFNAVRDTVDFTQKTPRFTYNPNCQYVFKDKWCQYSGSVTSCDNTITTCIALGNICNYGGYPSIPSQSVIKS